MDLRLYAKPAGRPRVESVERALQTGVGNACDPKQRIPCALPRTEPQVRPRSRAAPIGLSAEATLRGGCPWRVDERSSRES